MKTITVNYKTRTGSGLVTITAAKESHVASFDGLKEVKVTIGIKDGISTLAVNLKELSDAGFNCPKLNSIAAIALPSVNHKDMLEALTEKAEAGKWCGDGIFRTYSQLKTLTYTEQVLAGEYTE